MTPKATTDPTTGLFNLTAALQPYVQPYESMMDVLLGGSPTKAPTLSQAVQAGMKNVAPYLSGLPSGMAQTVENAIKPEFTALAGLPSAVNASVQTSGTSGLLTDLIAAAREQTLYGLGLPGQPYPPGALGALEQEVRGAGSSLLPSGTLSTTSPAGTSSIASGAPSLPGG